MPNLPPMFLRTRATPCHATVTPLGFIRAAWLCGGDWLVPRLIPLAYAAFCGWLILTIGGAL